MSNYVIVFHYPAGYTAFIGNGKYRLIDGNHRCAANSATEAYFIYLS